MILGEVGGDGELPGFQGRIALKGGQVLTGFKPGFLYNVLGIRKDGGDAQDIGAQLGPDGLEFSSEGFLHLKALCLDVLFNICLAKEKNTSIWQC